MALNRVPYPSPNYSSRGGTAVRLVVVHTAEGSRSIESLGSYFANPASGVSSHVGIDDKPNTVGEYVKPSNKAWTQANANPYSVAAELCAFASWTTEWNQHSTMLANTAAWIAEECARFNIPLRRLNASQAQGGQAGVCGHNELGAAGGNHWDPGPGFPWDSVMSMAAGKPAGGTSPTTKEEDNMVLADLKSRGTWVAYPDGAVYALDGAPYLGGCNNTKYNAQKWPCVGIGDNNGDGYVLVLDAGNRNLKTYRFPRDGSAAVK